jgi:hypothetical protein
MIVWSYSIFGSNTEVYYKPMLDNIRLAKSNNIKVVISTTEQYLNIVRNYFFHELEYIHIETYPSDKYVGLETILRFLTVEKIDADYYFIKDSDSIVTARELYIMNHWILISKFNFIIIRDNPLHVAPMLSGRRTGAHALTPCLSHIMFGPLPLSLVQIPHVLFQASCCCLGPCLRGPQWTDWPSSLAPLQDCSRCHPSFPHRSALPASGVLVFSPCPV